VRLTKQIVILNVVFIQLALPVFANSSGGINKQPHVISFKTAKNKMYSQVFNNNGYTFYCGCSWSNRKVNLKSCNLQSYFSKGQSKRALRSEAEHIIPASWMLKSFGKIRQCALDSKNLKGSARDYCRKKDSQYKQAHNDLVNLYPAVGQINEDRSNSPFSDGLKGKFKTYGKCDIKINNRSIVPPNDKKGDIARIARYMVKYGVTYSKRQVALFNKWDIEDPISIEERAHNKRIIKAQGFGLEL